MLAALRWYIKQILPVDLWSSFLKQGTAHGSRVSCRILYLQGSEGHACGRWCLDFHNSKSSNMSSPINPMPELRVTVNQ